MEISIDNDDHFAVRNKREVKTSCDEALVFSGNCAGSEHRLRILAFAISNAKQDKV